MLCIMLWLPVVPIDQVNSEAHSAAKKYFEYNMLTSLQLVTLVFCAFYHCLFCCHKLTTTLYCMSCHVGYHDCS